VQELLDRCGTQRDRAIVALLAYGGLRRSEVVTLDIADFDPGFGLPRVHGKGGHEAAVPLPALARAIVADHLRADRPDAAASEPLFVVRYPTIASKVIMRRMSGRHVWTLVRDLGERSGIKGPPRAPTRVRGRAAEANEESRSRSAAPASSPHSNHDRVREG